MRVLLTGGTGFIGSHTAELLLSLGWEVVCPVRNVDKLRNLKNANVTAIPLDSLDKTIREGAGFDYAIHMAGATRAPSYEAFLKANVGFTKQILEALSKAPAKETLKRFVLVSSQAAAGPAPDHKTPVPESDPPRPVSLYGRSKLEAERAVMEYADSIPVTIVRPSTVFGPRDRDVLSVFQAARFRLAPCLAGPDRRVSILYVRDLVQGVLAAAMSANSIGKTYFLANPDPVVWKEFSLRVAAVMGYKAVSFPMPLTILKIVGLGGDLIGNITGSTPLYNSEKLKDAKQIAWVCSVEKAAQDLGWRAGTDMDEAIKETFKWYKSNKWI